MLSSRLRGLLLVLPLGALLAGCDDDNGPTGPGENDPPVLTVNATTDWAFASLAPTSSVVQVGDPASSSNWDIGFFATAVMLNGGAAGPGGVEGFCLCQNDGATNDQIRAMTAAGELAAFEAVTAAQIPTDEDAWETDALDPAIDGWWSYDMATHTPSAVTTNSWIVRTSDGTQLAKLRVAAMVDPVRQNAGKVTFEFASWDGTGYGATRSATLDASAGPAYLNLVTGATGDAASWDIRLEGYTIRVNGGVSGSGNTAVVDAGTPFDVTDPADEPPASVFVTDRFGGAFTAHPWYFYDRTDHQIWPKYNVYLIRKGDEVYKIQLISYYNPGDGADRHISFRYERLVPAGG